MKLQIKDEYNINFKGNVFYLDKTNNLKIGSKQEAISAMLDNYNSFHKILTKGKNRVIYGNDGQNDIIFDAF